MNPLPTPRVGRRLATKHVKQRIVGCFVILVFVVLVSDVGRSLGRFDIDHGRFNATRNFGK